MKNTQEIEKIRQQLEPIEPKQRFTGYWIPVELTNLGLTKIEQCLLAMIDSLDSGAPFYCFASNAYLAKHMDLSESRISYYITKFRKMGLIQALPYDGKMRKLKTIKSNWYREKIEKFKKYPLRENKKGSTRKQEGGVRENAYHIEKKYTKENIIIAPGSTEPSAKCNQTPAAGNNNLFSCLDSCSDLSPKQKRTLMAFPEEIVAQAVQYAYHPETNVRDGPIGRFKLLQYFCKNHEDFAETMANLGKPKLTEKEKLLKNFTRGKTYNGYEFLSDEIGIGFVKDGMYQPYSVRWDSKKFCTEFIEVLKKIGIEIVGEKLRKLKPDK